MDYFHVMLMVCLAGMIGYDIGRRMEARLYEGDEEEDEERTPWGYVVKDGGTVDGGEPDYESWE
ncbi:MAG: hypothetical protein EBY40_00245 [Marivivens sp.]|nr:hypothetical protein [Marivivens sp.]NBT50014.1 hypothetical protein [Marivivens sp.]NCW67038.1 hypothetical protein [Marivivens sp.]NDH01539.1 hypothetical protein [Marivivens sp.]